MTDISVKDDPAGKALVLMCDEKEVGRISYEEAYQNLKAGKPPQELIRERLENLDWAMGTA
jgi:hypothetical protein